ncbi:hypothetical protein Droror1_Dr00006318 [Drosera rotundifolia]
MEELPMAQFADDAISDPYSPYKRAVRWLGEDIFMKDPQALNGLSLAQWMNMLQIPSLGNPMQAYFLPSLSTSLQDVDSMLQIPSLGNSMQAYFLPSLSTSLQDVAGTDLSPLLGFAASQINQQNGLQFNTQMPSRSVQQLE